MGSFFYSLAIARKALAAVQSRTPTTWLILILAMSAPFAQTTCPFNTRAANATDRALPTVDGQLFVRYARGLRDSALVGALTRANPAPNASAVAGHIDGNVAAFDIDGDGEFTQVDSLVITRYLHGFRGNSLVAGLAIPATATRRTSALIAKFIDDGCAQDLPVMPVEVIGPAGYVEAITVTLGDVTNINRLWLQCHRCGWRDGTVQSGLDRGAKASVRLNGGIWVDVSNATATVEQPEKSYGGIGGGFNTTRFTIPITGARKGKNTLEFRFNVNDGLTSGYRILGLNFLRSDNRTALGKYSTTWDDPTKWTAQPSSITSPNVSADIAAGRALWNGSTALKESPLSSTLLRASCSSCHAADGRDLKYFNYSDWSIQERAKFHGLSTTQGKQLAAYIRSLNVPAPKQARPWNPPYQPGPGLDTKPVTEWAAGAGLDAVLREDRQMLAYLFPNGTAQAEINKVIDNKKTLNVRELPVALQLPDWNDWLPHVHPIDLWGNDYTASDIPAAYSGLVQNLAADSASMVSDKRIIGAVNDFMNRSWRAGFAYMGGPIPCILYTDAKTSGTLSTNSLVDRMPAGKTCEDALHSLNPWLAVKNWEIFHTYALEDKTPVLHPYGERRGWFGRVRNVFEVASHRSADNSQNFRFQSYALGSYHSNVWYHLQLILNAGNRDPYTWFPQDWFYTPMFISLNSRDNNMPLATLLTAMQVKMYQNLDMTGPDGNGADRGADYNGWWLPFVTPWRFESALGWEGPSSRWNNVVVPAGTTPSKGFPWSQLNTYESGLRTRVTNALLRQFLVKQKSYPIAQLKRRSSTETDSAYFEDATYVLPSNAGDEIMSCYYPCPGGSEQALPIYRALTRFREINVDSALRGELIDYMKQLFPNSQNNWDALR
jgi:hypothetical protein